MSLLVLAKEEASDDANFKWFMMALIDMIYCYIVIPGWLMERAASVVGTKTCTEFEHPVILHQCSVSAWEVPACVAASPRY